MDVYGLIINFYELVVIYPISAQCPNYKNFGQNFNLGMVLQKNFLWASQLWVGRRKEPILDYVPKN